LIGQRNLVRAIRNQVAKRMPQAWLFHGPSGTGKTTLARIVALSYQCQQQKQWGQPCDECWKNWDSLAIHEINASEVNKVEDMREVVERARYRPLPPSSKRVFILDEAQRLTTQAQNLLLKPFEEPAESTIWIICTTEPGKILATLKRRCMTYALRPLTMDDTEKFLKHYVEKLGIETDTAQLTDAVHQANISSPAMLLMVLDKLAAKMPIVEAVAGIGDASSLAICKAVSGGDWSSLRAELLKLSNDDARFLRASVGGWLRGILLKDPSPSRQRMMAQSLSELMGDAPLDDTILMPWLTAKLYQITERFSKER
jgi:DNA polymerase-3 subunit gamma/tau